MRIIPFSNENYRIPMLRARMKEAMTMTVKSPSGNIKDMRKQRLPEVVMSVLRLANAQPRRSVGDGCGQESETRLLYHDTMLEKK